MKKTIYFTKTKNGMWLFSYNGITQRYLDYSFKESLILFKEKVGLKYKKNVNIVEDNFCGTYGYMYD